MNQLIFEFSTKWSYDHDLSGSDCAIDQLIFGFCDKYS